jgi:hypothetical protein
MAETQYTGRESLKKRKEKPEDIDNKYHHKTREN